jgi:hypothetical protein
LTRSASSHAPLHEASDFDGTKKNTGCKRPLSLDTLGLILAMVVTAADTNDRRGFGAFAMGVEVVGMRNFTADFQQSFLQDAYVYL